jgi:hypothetical protein
MSCEVMVKNYSTTKSKTSLFKCSYSGTVCLICYNLGFRKTARKK